MFSVIDLELSPVSDGLVPHSDGYLVYSALLDSIRSFDEDDSELIHTKNGGVNISCLDGSFKYHDNNRKKVFADGVYTVKLTFVGEDIPLTTILSCLMGSNTDFMIGDVKFEIVSFNVTESNMNDLHSKCTDESITIEFDTPTRISHNEVTEVFPHRTVLIKSILKKWNHVFDEKMNIENISNAVYIQGGSIELNHHNVRVAGARESSIPAFTGRISINKTPSCTESKWNKIQLLLYAGEYLGVGSDIKRGLGSIKVY